ncbi:MBL fold metallo-hydrolase [Burkholderia gladioli]|uniref:MBL fold metallo-hydrolase n=1 Tax=Burkholderia gladioli TaxID=28095 RepID=UPI0016404BA5|nr:MBL fold metallo-hydrolase [Burkholderia gladioli]
MKIIYLGHQGWSIQASSGWGSLIIDHVGSVMGNGRTTVEANYPMAVEIDSLSAADAILISHEHADHFNLKVLRQIFLNRPGLVALVPDLISPALPRFLDSIGANVIRYSSFHDVEIGDIVVTPLPSKYSRYEPDVYGLLIMDRSDGTSFFTSIDAIPSELTIDYLKTNNSIRTLDNFTNNYIYRHFRQHDLPFQEKLFHVNTVLSHFDQFIDTFGSNHIIVSGLGWRYAGNHSPLNDMLFPVEHHDIVQAREKALAFVHAAEAGDELHLSSGGVVKVVKHGVKARPRGFDNRAIQAWIPDVGEQSVTDHQWQILTHWIESTLSVHVCLGAHRIKAALHHLMMEGNAANLILAVRQDNRFYVFSFALAEAKFVLIGIMPDLESCRQSGPFGLAITAASLDGIRCGMDEAHINFEIDAVTWNRRWDLLPECVDVDVSACLHPRNRSEVFLKYYLGLSDE